MKSRLLFSLLCTLVLLSLSAASVFGMGFLAEQKWQLPGVSTAPVIHDTAAEQVQNELKAYPYQVLTPSAAEVLYADYFHLYGPPFSAMTIGDPLSAAEAAARAGSYAEALLGLDFSTVTADVLLIGDAENTVFWWVAYAPKSDLSTYPACCLRLDAFTGELLRLQMAPGEKRSDTYSSIDSSNTLLQMLEDAQAIAETLGLQPERFYGDTYRIAEHGFVNRACLWLADDRILTVLFPRAEYSSRPLEICLTDSAAWLVTNDNIDAELSFLKLPFAMPQPIEEASALAAEGHFGRLIDSSTATDGHGVWLGRFIPSRNSYQLLYLDPATNTAAPYCAQPDCTHTQSSCPADLAFSVWSPFYLNGELYLYKPTEWNADAARIEHFCADGSRETLCELPGSYRLLLHDGFLYTVCRTDVNPLPNLLNTSYTRHQLTCIDPGTGECTVIDSLPFDMQPMGSVGNILLLSAGINATTLRLRDEQVLPCEEGYRVLVGYDLSTGELFTLPETSQTQIQCSLGTGWEFLSYAPLSVGLYDLFSGRELMRFEDFPENFQLQNIETDLFDNAILLTAYNTETSARLQFLLFPDGSRSLLSNALFAAGSPLIATDTHVLFRIPDIHLQDRYFFVPRGDLFTATAAYPTVQFPESLHPAG